MSKPKTISERIKTILCWHDWQFQHYQSDRIKIYKHYQCYKCGEEKRKYYYTVKDYHNRF